MGKPRTDMIPVQEGFRFEAVNLTTRLPETHGWYLLCTNALPHSCGKLWFDGKEFNLNNHVYSYSSLLAQGMELFWLELIQEGAQNVE